MKAKQTKVKLEAVYRLTEKEFLQRTVTLVVK